MLQFLIAGELNNVLNMFVIQLGSAVCATYVVLKSLYGIDGYLSYIADELEREEH